MKHTITARISSDYIKNLYSQGYNADSIYRLAAGELGLFGVAFFGHKGNKGDKPKLQRVWKRILNLKP